MGQYLKIKKMRKLYRIFISHSWKYEDAYKSIITFLDKQKSFTYYDHSVPKNDPIHTNGSDKQLKKAIDAKIKGTSCILIITGVYANYSKWILKEIELAKKYNKTIIAVDPWGAKKTSLIVKNNSDVIVKWNGESIIKAIKKHA